MIDGSRLITAMQYLYYLIDPRDGLPFYVGRTTDPTMRLLTHIKDAKRARKYGNVDRDAVIRDLLVVGLEPMLSLVSSLTDETSARREEFVLIQHVRNWNPTKLTNKQTQIN